MNKKRNVNYIKPEDPEFLKVLKKQAGYDDRNHKFDKPENNEEDFVDDKDSELPQVVVLKEGDLTAEEAEAEKSRLERMKSETKADLSEKVIFQPKKRVITASDVNKRKHREEDSRDKLLKGKRSRCLLSFNDDDED